MESKTRYFFEHGAAVNGPDDSFWKSYVYASNAFAKDWDPDSAAAQRLNQDVTDQLAQTLLNEYLEAISEGEVLSPADIYGFDKNAFIEGFGLDESGWTGGAA